MASVNLRNYDFYFQSTGFCGRSVPDGINPSVQKDRTYNILSRKYEEQLKKYNNATEAYKQTAEYVRLKAIVLRLRGTLKQMEQDMGR